MDGAGGQVEPLPWWMAAIFFAASAEALHGHFSFKNKGRMAVLFLRSNYFNEYLPPLARYAPLNLLPGSIVSASWGGIVVMSHLPDNDLTDYIIVVLAISSLIAGIVCVKRHLTGYPDEIKPQWLIDEERRRRNGPDE